MIKSSAFDSRFLNNEILWFSFQNPAACVGGVSVRALLCARGLVERRPKRDR